MATIKLAIKDILNRLSSIPVRSNDGRTVPLHARIWNNQIQHKAEGTTYAYSVPAAFVEVVSPATFQTIGEGVRTSDLAFRIHIEVEMIDGGDDVSMDQNVLIFDLRDTIIQSLHFFQPAGCGPLEAVTEGMDYEHTNVYHYVIDFASHFLDTAAQKQYIIKQPPTEAQFIINNGTNS